MAVEKSSKNKQKKNMRWLDGYNFWRGQYAVRNSEFVIMERVGKDLKIEFMNKAREILDANTLDILGLGEKPNIPKLNDKYIDTLKSLPDDVFNILRQLSCLENYIAKIFPYFFTPERIDAESIIQSLLNESFESKICTKNNNRESLLYPGVSYFDTSKNVMLVSNENIKTNFITLDVDCSADIGHILRSVCALIEAQKAQKGENFYSCKEFLDIDLELFLTKKRPGVAYNVGTRSDNSRAIGLWVHDHMEHNGCTQAAAIEAFVRLPYLKDLGGADSDSYRDALKRMHRQTKKCVQRVEVLKIQ